MDYNDCTNKPTINGVEVKDNLEITDIGIVEMPTEMISDIFETFSGGQTPLQAILQSKQADADEEAGESEGDLDDAFN